MGNQMGKETEGQNPNGLLFPLSTSYSDGSIKRELSGFPTGAVITSTHTSPDRACLNSSRNCPAPFPSPATCARIQAFAGKCIGHG